MIRPRQGGFSRKQKNLTKQLSSPSTMTSQLEAFCFWASEAIFSGLTTVPGTGTAGCNHP